MRIESAERKGWTRFGVFLAAFFLAAGTGFAQPELKVTLPERAARVGEPYRVMISVSWAGKPSDWAILPAVPVSIDWGTAEVALAASSVRDGINFIEQTVTITPARSGEVTVPEILIPYRTPEALTPPETSAPATNPTGPGVDPTLRAEPFILHVKPDRTQAGYFGGLGVLLFLLLGLGWRFARRRRSPTGPFAFSARELPSEPTLLQEARRHRLDGHPYEFYLSLNRALSVCPGEIDLIKRIRERAQNVGYQGVVPAEAQMNADYEEVERVLARYPREEARSA